eukprot:374198-Pleurochrysis_carterae.AAC.1
MPRLSCAHPSFALCWHLVFTASYGCKLPPASVEMRAKLSVSLLLRVPLPSCALAFHLRLRSLHPPVSLSSPP